MKENTAPSSSVPLSCCSYPMPKMLCYLCGVVHRRRSAEGLRASAMGGSTQENHEDAVKENLPLNTETPDSSVEARSISSDASTEVVFVVCVTGGQPVEVVSELRAGLALGDAIERAAVQGKALCAVGELECRRESGVLVTDWFSSDHGRFSNRQRLYLTRRAPENPLARRVEELEGLLLNVRHAIRETHPGWAEAIAEHVPRARRVDEINRESRK